MCLFLGDVLALLPSMKSESDNLGDLKNLKFSVDCG